MLFDWLLRCRGILAERAAELLRSARRWATLLARSMTQQSTPGQLAIPVDRLCPLAQRTSFSDANAYGTPMRSAGRLARGTNAQEGSGPGELTLRELLLLQPDTPAPTLPRLIRRNKPPKRARHLGQPRKLGYGQETDDAEVD